MKRHGWINVFTMFFVIAKTALAIHVDSMNHGLTNKHLEKRIVGYLEYLDDEGVKSTTNFSNQKMVTLGDRKFILHDSSEQKLSRFSDKSANLIPVHYFAKLIQSDPYIVLPEPIEKYQVGSKIQLNASDSVSPDGSILKFSWSIYEPSVSPAFSKPLFLPDNLKLGEPSISFTAEKKGDYRIRLEIKNSTGTASKEFIISVGGSRTLRWSLNDRVFLDSETSKRGIPYIVLNDLTQPQRLKMVAGWKDLDGKMSYSQSYAWRPLTLELFGLFFMPTFASFPLLETRNSSTELVFRNPEWGGYYFLADSTAAGVHLDNLYPLEIMGNPNPSGPASIDTSDLDKLSWGLKNVNAEKAWETTKGSRDVKIAVIDTGINYLNKDISPNLVWKDGEMVGSNLIDDKVRPFDNQSHGTHCAGIIAGVEGNGGVLGVAPKVSIIPYKALDGFGGGTILNLARAIYRATNDGVDIISASWGLNGLGVLESELKLLKNAIKFAADKGITFVVAAGNEEMAVSGEFDSYIPIPVSFRTENMISVAATTLDDELASFSNFGNFVDVAAPGHRIISDINANSKGIKTAIYSGTSMATPLVAGIVGLMKSVNKDLSPREIKNILIKSSRYVPNLDGKIHSNGIVDAAEAVRMASEKTP